MFHAPTSESKEQNDPSRNQSMAERSQELSPRVPVNLGHVSSGAAGNGIPTGASLNRSQQFARLHKAYGNQAVLRMLSHPAIQTKLTVNQLGDPFEQEADRVADQVIRMTAVPVVQRTCTSCKDEDKLQRKCAECEEEEKKTELQRKENTAGPQFAPPSVHDVLNSPGQPLDPATRAFMEPRFGHDFSSVRLHTDAEAADSARAMNALAYAVGTHVVFGADQFKPHEAFGKQLLAHELTHVLQQIHDVGVSPSVLEVDDGGVRVEQEANDNAEAAAGDLTPLRVKSAERAKIRRAPPPAPTATRSAPAKCEPESTAEGKELVGARGTLEKSRTVAHTILPPKPPSDLAYWFAELYYYITLYEIDGRSAFSHPAFVMHFIPIFYDMYAQNAEHFTKQEPEKIVPNWQEHFATASAIVDPSMVYPYLMAAQRSLISGVSAHIKGDMPAALEQAYRTYSALYCDVPPFNTYHTDFFEQNIKIFEKVRITFINELINRGLGLAMYGKSVDPEILSKAADIIGAGLKIDEIYGWRETAWKTAKSRLS